MSLLVRALQSRMRLLEASVLARGTLTVRQTGRVGLQVRQAQTCGVMPTAV
jgi:hypothetical protein